MTVQRPGDGTDQDDIEGSMISASLFIHVDSHSAILSDFYFVAILLEELQGYPLVDVVVLREKDRE